MRVSAALVLLATIAMALPLLGASGHLQGREVETTGDLIVQSIDDFESGESILAYAIREPDGSVVQLLGPSVAQMRLSTGTQIKVRGRLGEAGILVEAIEPLPFSASPSQFTALIGSRKTVIILVNMANATLGSNCSTSQVASELFTASGSMAAFYEESSFGQLHFPADSNGNGQPDIYGPFLIADSTADGTGTPPRFTWIQHAEAAATAAGVNFAGYDHRIFMFPRAGDTPGQAPCTTAWGYVGPCSGPCYVAACSLGAAWSSDCLGSSVFAHEIGHNLGMMHASVDANNDGVIDVTANGSEEYGDGSDVMGNGHCGWRDSLFHPNGPHKGDLGWFDAFSGAKLTVSAGDLAAGPVTRWISAIEANPGATADPELLELPGGYYLTTRQAVGFDSGLDVDCEFDVFNPFSGRTSVHHFSVGRFTLLTAMLDDGISFATGGFRVTQLAHTQDSVLVQIGSPGLIFGDGFELGSAEAWSSAEP